MVDIDHIKALFSLDSSWFSEVDLICNALSQLRDSLFLVDGHFGSGKSHLAGAISRRLGMAHVDVDPFCAKGNETYLQHIDYDGLSRVIGDGKRTVLSGIMALAVVEKLNAIRAQEIDLAEKIYVIRIGKLVTF